MEAWVEEAVNESSKAIDWLYSDSFDFDFLFFGCVRDRSMSPRLVLAASKSTYALCSGSLIRKIELGWGSTM